MTTLDHNRPQPSAAIGADAARRLDEVAAAEGVSIADALLATAAVLVHRFIGWDEVVVGTSAEPPGDPVDAWSDPIDGSRLVLVPIDVSDDPTFNVVLRRIRNAAASSGRTTAARPLAPLHLLLQSGRQRHVLVDERPGPSEQARPAVVVSILGDENGWRLRSITRGDVDYIALENIVRSLAHLLTAAGATPSQRISRLPLLDAEHYRLIVDAWNETGREYPAQPAHSLFTQRAAIAPNAPAVKDGERILTYGELDAHANRVANHLVARGVRRGSGVGVCLTRSADAIITILAILKSGGAYIPMDPGYPAARLYDMLEECRPEIVVTTSLLRRRVPERGDFAVVEIDAEAEAIAMQSERCPQSGVTVDDPAYILYTSGSSGRPKPILNTHRSIVNGLCEPPFDADDPDNICCLTSSLSFGFSIARLFLPLLCGRLLVIMPDGQEKDLLATADFWAAERIGNIGVVTPVARELLAFGRRVSDKLSRVRTVVVGGSAVQPDLIADILGALPKATLLVGYAATELGGPILNKGFTRESLSFDTVVAGRPFPNIRVYVLDAGLEPVPPGVTGEIFVAAPHLSRGYVGQPARTAERFIANPFATRPGDRLYRTGDLGRFLPTGEVEVLGRTDDMVKVRGFRIELQEIESVLNTHPQVAAAAATVRELSGEPRVIAYVVGRDAVAPQPTDLREYLRLRLPDYMMPSRFVVVDRLPLSEAGKIDRARLPDVGAERPVIDCDYEPPRDELESELAVMWESLLSIDGIGIHDDFLALGGDSMFAARLTGLLAERYQLDLPVAMVFERPTIAAQADYVRAEIGGYGTADVASI